MRGRDISATVVDGRITDVEGIRLTGSDSLQGRMGYDRALLSRNDKNLAVFFADGAFRTCALEGNRLVRTWDADRSGNTNHGFIDMQRDGNFVIRDDDRDIEFRTGTDLGQGPDYTLTIRNDGALAIKTDPRGPTIWSNARGAISAGVLRWDTGDGAWTLGQGAVHLDGRLIGFAGDESGRLTGFSGRIEVGRDDSARIDRAVFRAGNGTNVPIFVTYVEDDGFTRAVYTPLRDEHDQKCFPGRVRS